MGVGSRRQPAGFTLIELMIVIFIIGLMASFILVVSFEGIRRAEERATQSLITKLETGVTDRIEALLSTQTNSNQRHLDLATIPGVGKKENYVDIYARRAQVIARVDQLRAELPDVFFVQFAPGSLPQPGGSGFADPIYPINFAGLPFPPPAASAKPTPLDYILPLGNGTLLPAGSGFPGTGIYGASYAAAGALYKNLGNVPPQLLPAGRSPNPYRPTGYDGVDNNGNGWVDEWAEGIDAENYDAVVLSLTNHTHKTARSEMLYALLVEGAGPFGSAFSPEDFTAREVQDTDSDGLPEFVDAWGEPLQFFRWPVYYRSDLQKGAAPYVDRTQARQQNPLDPNQDLVAPAWWLDLSASTPPTNSRQMSIMARLFHRSFFSLLDPQADVGSPVTGSLWDRGGFYRRRAYFSKFLIVSSGPDRLLGIAQFDVDYDGTAGVDIAVKTAGPAAPDTVAENLILIENQAAQTDPVRPAGAANLYQQEGDDSRGVNSTLFVNGQDDISNQTIQAAGTGLR